MDTSWMPSAVSWVSEHLPEVSPAESDGQKPEEGRRTADFLQKGVDSARAAITDWKSGDSYMQNRARWELANGCQNIGRNMASAEAAPAWLSIALLLYESLGEKFRDSLQATLATYRTRTGSDNPTELRERLPFSVDITKSHEFRAEPPQYEQDAASEEAEAEADSRGSHAVMFTKLLEAEEGAANLELLSEDWHGTGDMAASADGFCASFLVDAGAPAVIHSAVSPFLVEDCQYLKSLLSHCGTASEPQVLLRRAQSCRGLATHIRLDSEAALTVIRRCWVASAFWNKQLLGLWPNNRVQVAIDAMGYVGALHVAYRYRDDQVQIVLAVAEAQLMMAAGKPVLLQDKRTHYVAEWLTNAVGTYLLLGGPEHVAPADTDWSPHTPRDAATGARLPRSKWPQALLSRWNTTEYRMRGAFCLAKLTGWDYRVLEFLLKDVLVARAGLEAETAEKWRMAVEELRRAADAVHVVSDPWEKVPGESAEQDPQAKEQTSRLSRAILRSLACEFADFERYESVHLSGSQFEGRRLPTYLLSSRHGPFGIMKLDSADKIDREVVGFDRHARDLHPVNRPATCRAGELRIWDVESAEPIKAVFTEYAFSRGEQAQTMASWLAGCPEEVATSVLGDFLTNVLYDWVGHVRRERLDLRDEYSVLRPLGVLGSSRRRSALEELDDLESAFVSSALGFSLRRDGQRIDVTDLPRYPSGAPMIPDHLGLRTLVNPLWFCRELSDDSGGHFRGKVFETTGRGLASYDTLVATCHGDMHLENVLCASRSRVDEHPRLIIIDFESAHEGHVCKDFARLEASVLLQLFCWTEDESAALIRWFGESCAALATKWQQIDGTASAAPAERPGKAVACAAALRRMAEGCGQLHWPLASEEYVLSLLAAILPVVRYRKPTSYPRTNRQLAYVLAAIAATALAQAWGDESPAQS